MEAWPPFSQYRWHPLFGITDGRYKWVRGRADRLYDLSTDPGESKNLANAPPAAALVLKAKFSPPPAAAPSEGRVDPALLGLGYAPAPGGRFDPATLPDPYDGKAAILQDIAQARAERNSGRLDQAAARLKLDTERDAGDPFLWFEFGETLRRAGKSTEAASALGRAVAISPQFFQAWAAMGHALVAQRKNNEAARCYEKALALQPDFTLALNPLAACYFSQNEMDRANALLDRAVSSGIADSRTYLLRANLRLVHRRNEDAAKDFEVAVRLSAQPEKTLNEEADIYMEEQQAEAGQRLYLDGIRRYPTYAPNYLGMGSYFLQMDRPEQALPYFKKALDCDLDPRTRERVQDTIRKLDAAVGPAHSAQSSGDE